MLYFADSESESDDSADDFELLEGIANLAFACFRFTPARTHFISGLKSRVLKLTFFILKFTEPLQSCCCPEQKYLPRMAELAWQLSRYL